MAGRRIEIGMVMASPNVIDDRVPGQPEEPAPERDAPRLVARQGLQGLDEDELRQVLRVRRAMDAAGDVAIDRQVEVVEQEPECPRVPRAGLAHQPLDGVVVDGHNERPAITLGAAASPNSTSMRSPPRRKASEENPAATAASYPSASPHANDSARCASEPTVTARPPMAR